MPKLAKHPMKRLFISDLHLEDQRPDLTRALFDFLKGPALEADALFILGDFFEVWLGDDDTTVFNQSIIDALQAYPKPIFIMPGNRDFLLGQVFCQAIGATLLPDSYVVMLGDSRVLLMHGDSLCTRDAAYMQARLMLRDKNFQKDFLSKPIDERKLFARALRQQSKVHTREKATDIMDVTPAEVIQSMLHHGVDRFIHGHTHRPGIHNLTLTDGSTAKRYVLGDWDQFGWYITAIDEMLSLHQFKINP